MGLEEEEEDLCVVRRKISTSVLSEQPWRDGGWSLVGHGPSSDERWSAEDGFSTHLDRISPVSSHRSLVSSVKFSSVQFGFFFVCRRRRGRGRGRRYSYSAW